MSKLGKVYRKFYNGIKGRINIKGNHVPFKEDQEPKKRCNSQPKADKYYAKTTKYNRIFT